MDRRSLPVDRVVLVGFMGAGKTTVGKLLAEKVHWPFLDLDDEIVRQEDRSIAAIFQAEGEDYFRRCESETLATVLKAKSAPYILAVGGGAYVHPGNAELLREAGVRSVFLDAGVEELRGRCGNRGVDRPLARDPNLFRQLYEARRSGYMAADLHIDSSGKSPQQVVEHILEVLGSGGGRQ